ncbi:nucleotidyltransferase [Sporosarcina siberiensis]|uniref:tRNA(Met) cytidine acetate ligase n=1 Tax=Sporosarcina siberiensis TaxID=1365606 RepID=A0ABW4SK23_9BACL
MKAIGIVVEYNPFHNGHVYHIEQARKSTSADVVIAVMSGNFLQRGEPAFVDKWARTTMALQGGADLVLELPYVYATAHAPVFAKGAIELLDAIGCDAFCFGSEDGDIKPFEQSISVLQNAGDKYEQIVKEAVQSGLSYPKALNEAYLYAVQLSGQSLPVADLTKPNNILGFHYMQAAREINSTMAAATIPRIIAGYHDDADDEQTIASATGIRKSFFDFDTLDSVRNFFPQGTFNTLTAWRDDKGSFGNWDSFYPLLRFTILREGPKRLAEIADIAEGIENLMFRAAKNNNTFEGFMSEVKSKRYTWTRIQRMLTHIYTGFTYEHRNEIGSASYLRLLGMTEKGQLYLNKNKKKLKLPLISKAAAFSDPSLQMDIHSADMYALGIAHNTNPPIVGGDFKRTPIILP